MTQHVDTLKKLRAKMVEQRRNMAARLVGVKDVENFDRMIAVQASIEATDRAIAEEEKAHAASLLA